MNRWCKIKPQPATTPAPNDKYIRVGTKFWIGHAVAFLWVAFSVIVSIPWLNDLSKLVTRPVAVMIIAGIGYIPGYINAFIVTSLLADRQPPFKTTDPKDPVTILIACRNEEENIAMALRYIKDQDYRGDIKVLVIDNGSTDRTYEEAEKAAAALNLSIQLVFEPRAGKHNALNAGLAYVTTPHLITLDADTVLHRSAVRFVMARMKSAPPDVCAVAGAVLVKNSRESFITRLQEWDYFLGIASIKRMQGLFQGTLVAQGAYSLYETEAVKQIGGWPDAIGEDIVVTWKFFAMDRKVYFEPHAVAFTVAPATLTLLARQRSRWARGMIEGLKVIKPWEQPLTYIRYLTGINLVMPYLDFIYTFVWMPGLVCAFFGKFWIVGPVTLFVLPLALLQNYILNAYQSRVFKTLDLKIRKNRVGFLVYVLCYQMLMSPMSILGYAQEFLSLRRVWK